MANESIYEIQSNIVGYTFRLRCVCDGDNGDDMRFSKNFQNAQFSFADRQQTHTAL